MLDKHASWLGALRACAVAILLCASAPCAADTLQEGRAAISSKDYAKALGLLRPLAEAGNPVAQEALGALYVKGWGVALEYGEALKWFRKAAEQNEPRAQYSLGAMYGHGLGVNKDYAEALNWFRKAAEQNEPRAQHSLGVMYSHGVGVGMDHSEAAKWLRKAAEQNDPSAQYDFGAMYADGRGVNKDFSEAAKWFHRSADQGFMTAQAALGTLYGRGDGVPQDSAAAMSWYRKAADQDEPDAQGRLGWMYLEGESVAKDFAEAEKWFRRSASQGHPRGQFGLGRMYLSGWGVEEDMVEAAKWMKLAAEKWPLMTNLVLTGPVVLPSVADGRTAEEQDSILLLRAVSASSEALAQSHLAVSYQLKFFERARFGVKVITTIDGKMESIDQSNADRYVARHGKRLNMYSAAIRQRGFQRLAGEYDTAVHKSCNRIGLLAGKTVLEQEEFRIAFGNGPFSSSLKHRGVVVESTLAIEHAMDPQLGFVGSADRGRIELKNESTGCVVTLTRQ